MSPEAPSPAFGRVSAVTFNYFGITYIEMLFFDENGNEIPYTAPSLQASGDSAMFLTEIMASVAIRKDSFRFRG